MHRCPTLCPVCGLTFPSTLAVCSHLQDSVCARKFLPTPSAFRVPQRSSDKPRTGQFHPRSGYIYGFNESNTFEHMKRHDYEPERQENSYYPFSRKDEWELGKFLLDNFTQSQIDTFLKLEWVRDCSLSRSPYIYVIYCETYCLQVNSRSQLSFRSARDLLLQMDAIPKGPNWCCTTIHFEGYPTRDPIFLYWCDGLEVVQELFGNPIFSPHMEYDPYIIMDGSEQEYGEWMSGNEAHQIQVSLLA